VIRVITQIECFVDPTVAIIIDVVACLAPIGIALTGRFAAIDHVTIDISKPGQTAPDATETGLATCFGIVWTTDAPAGPAMIQIGLEIESFVDSTIAVVV